MNIEYTRTVHEPDLSGLLAYLPLKLINVFKDGAFSVFSGPIRHENRDKYISGMEVVLERKQIVYIGEFTSETRDESLPARNKLIPPGTQLFPHAPSVFWSFVPLENVYMEFQFLAGMMSIHPGAWDENETRKSFSLPEAIEIAAARKLPGTEMSSSRHDFLRLPGTKTLV